MRYSTDRQTTSRGRRAGAPTAVDLGLGSRPRTATVGDPPSAFVRAAIDEQLRQLLARGASMRHNDSTEDVHQMRIAIRRIRAALTAGAAFLDVDDELTAPLKWLGGLLGVVRDLDVLRQRVEAMSFDPRRDFTPADRLAFDEVIGVLAMQRADANADLLAGLNSQRYTQLLRKLAELVRGKDGKSAVKTAPNAMLDKPYRALRKSISSISSTLEHEQLHRVRIRAKRLRYASELVVPQMKTRHAKPVIELASAAKKLQGLLGEYQDTVAAEQQLRDVAEAERTPLSSQALILIGRLIESEHSSRAKPLHHWPNVWRDIKHRAKLLDV